MTLNNSQLAFFELLRAGLWGKEARLSMLSIIDFKDVCQIAEEQSVVGLVAAGLEYITDVRAPKEDILKFVGQALQIEQRNKSMNEFVAHLTEQLRDINVYSILVKGQGVAQCYERPLWRTCGDVDLLLSDINYLQAKDFLIPLASFVAPEDASQKHLGLTINSWVVELHGSLHSGLTSRIDRGLDSVQDDVFCGGNVRTWMNGKTQIFLPGIDNDIIFIFSHILQHFFKGGIGLRQVCDLCRFLWTYKERINVQLLEKRIKNMGLMTEWKAFAALSVDYLGMPVASMPLYSSSKKWSQKASRILAFILETGNFGHNRDKSYYDKYPLVIYKAISLWRNTLDSMRHFMVFPKDAAVVWFVRLKVGVRGVVKKKGV